VHTVANTKIQLSTIFLFETFFQEVLANAQFLEFFYLFILFINDLNVTISIFLRFLHVLNSPT
jgi:hypothetical protein